jgi:endonuclease-3
MTDAIPASLTDRISDILALLEDAYGERRWRSHAGALDELIATVLSQHTSDTNTARSFASLKQRFDDWESVLVAPVDLVADAIRSGGLAEQKAPRIQGILAAIQEERGSLDLDHLDALPLVDARQWLLRLHGVGPKTAACVLLFSLGRPTLPVDTHVHRVAKRLGLIGPKVGADTAHGALEAGLGGDRDRVYSFHVTMIAHGRAVCTARRPYCERCPLTECCDYFRTTAARNTDPARSPAPPGGW